jgi:translation initiation factor 3 subunit G
MSVFAELPTLRVTNISEDTKDTDLRILFERFGAIQRIHLAKDKNTKLSKGYAFISFYNEKEAEKALKQLNGHGYDNLILQVDWAK